MKPAPRHSPRFQSSGAPMAGPIRLGGKHQRKILPMEEPGLFARLCALLKRGRP